MVNAGLTTYVIRNLFVGSQCNHHDKYKQVHAWQLYIWHLEHKDLLWHKD